MSSHPHLETRHFFYLSYFDFFLFVSTSAQFFFHLFLYMSDFLFDWAMASERKMAAFDFFFYCGGRRSLHLHNCPIDSPLLPLDVFFFLLSQSNCVFVCDAEQLGEGKKSNDYVSPRDSLRSQIGQTAAITTDPILFTSEYKNRE